MEEQVKTETVETEVTTITQPMASDAQSDLEIPTTDEKGFDLSSGLVGAAVTLVAGGVAIGVKKLVDFGKARKAKKEADAKDKADFEAFKAAQKAKAEAEVVEVPAEEIKPEAEPEKKEEKKPEKVK